MPGSKSRIFYLLKIYSSGKATPTEEQELFRWLAEGNETLTREYIEEFVSAYDQHGESQALDSDPRFQNIVYHSNNEIPAVDWDNLFKNIVAEKNSRDTEAPVRKILWPYRAAAAMVLLLMGVAYFQYTSSYKDTNRVAIEQPRKNDIAAPNSANATLTLSNGQKIVLDSTMNGTLAVQGSVKIDKLANGQIVYQGSDKEVQYNTLNNSRGSMIVSLTLADGTRVWLNSASSMRYPTAFNGDTREVEITGEAYLEVAHNPSMPFIVTKGNTSIKVLGTHFNVNAYDDENTVNVTLLEGKVNVTSADSRKSKVIKPGQQAQVNRNGNIELNNAVNLDEVMAWKKGLFSFKGADINTIMRQVSRWYNIDAVFEKPLHEKFYAEVSRNTSLATLLTMLESTKAVHFKIEGNSITVTPTP